MRDFFHKEDQCSKIERLQCMHLSFRKARRFLKSKATSIHAFVSFKISQVLTKNTQFLQSQYRCLVWWTKFIRMSHGSGAHKTIAFLLSLGNAKFSLQGLCSWNTYWISVDYVYFNYGVVYAVFDFPNIILRGLPNNSNSLVARGMSQARLCTRTRLTVRSSLY